MRAHLQYLPVEKGTQILVLSSVSQSLHCTAAGHHLLMKTSNIILLLRTVRCVFLSMTFAMSRAILVCCKVVTDQTLLKAYILFIFSLQSLLQERFWISDTSLTSDILLKPWSPRVVCGGETEHAQRAHKIKLGIYLDPFQQLSTRLYQHLCEYVVIFLHCIFPVRYSFLPSVDPFLSSEHS